MKNRSPFRGVVSDKSDQTGEWRTSMLGGSDVSEVCGNVTFNDVHNINTSVFMVCIAFVRLHCVPHGAQANGPTPGRASHAHLNLSKHLSSRHLAWDDRATMFASARVLALIRRVHSGTAQRGGRTRHTHVVPCNNLLPPGQRLEIIYFASAATFAERH